MNKKIFWGIVIALIFILLAFSGDKKDTNQSKTSTKPTNTAPTKDPVSTSTVSPSANSVSKSSRLLSIDISKHDDYNKAFNEAKSAGLQFMQLSLAWDDIDKKSENQDPWGLLGTTNTYYPPSKTGVALMIGPIDTNNNRMPDDLKGKNFDDPEVIERYKRTIDFVFSKLPNAQLNSLAIGNEIDVYLGSNDKKWQQYTNFFNQVASYAKSKRPGLKVGAKATYNGLIKIPELKLLNQYSDAVFVTYYGIKDNFDVKYPGQVKDDMRKITELYPNKDIQFLELGYPSSPLLGSSEEKQADFVREAFKAWDAYNQVKVINFVWSHDVPQSKLDEYAKYYGSSDKKFLAYLGTLGLKTNDDRAKLAWEALRVEAKARGW